MGYKKILVSDLTEETLKDDGVIIRISNSHGTAIEILSAKSGKLIIRSDGEVAAFNIHELTPYLKL